MEKISNWLITRKITAEGRIDRWVLLVLLLGFAIFLSVHIWLISYFYHEFFSPVNDIEWQGLDVYESNICSLGQTHGFFPSDNLADSTGAFVGKYEYVDGNFAHATYGELAKEGASCLMIAYLTYDGETYIKAKEDMQDKTIRSEKNVFSYNGYVLAENLSALVATDPKYSNLNEEGENEMFPWIFHMVGYCDEKNTLVFLAFYGSGEYMRLSEKNVGAFLKKYYPIYDFDA